MAKTTKKGKEKKTHKPGFLSNVMTEMKNVTWIKPRDLLTLVIFVLILCVVVAIFMMGLDFFFIRVREFLMEL